MRGVQEVTSKDS